jgi:hypothetical protein
VSNVTPKIEKPGHPFTSATRLSLNPYFVFATDSVSKSPTGQKPHGGSIGKIQRSAAFRPILTDGLALSENETYLLRLGKSCQSESENILFNRTEYGAF